MFIHDGGQFQELRFLRLGRRMPLKCNLKAQISQRNQKLISVHPEEIFPGIIA